jgi:hypothetical protein
MVNYFFKSTKKGHRLLFLKQIVERMFIAQKNMNGFWPPDYSFTEAVKSPHLIFGNSCFLLHFTLFLQPKKISK